METQTKFKFKHLEQILIIPAAFCMLSIILLLFLGIINFKIDEKEFILKMSNIGVGLKLTDTLFLNPSPLPILGEFLLFVCIIFATIFIMQQNMKKTLQLILVISFSILSLGGSILMIFTKNFIYIFNPDLANITLNTYPILFVSCGIGIFSSIMILILSVLVYKER